MTLLKFVSEQTASGFGKTFICAFAAEFKYK